MKTAILIDDNIDGFKGYASIYYLKKPLKVENSKGDLFYYNFIICSTYDGETVILPLDSKTGKLDESIGDLPKSKMYSDGKHKDVLYKNGYVIKNNLN